MHYKETQRMSVFFYIALFLGNCICAYFHCSTRINPISEAIVYDYLFFVFLYLVVFINFFVLVKYWYMDTVVDDKKIQVQFGIHAISSPPDIALEHIRTLRKIPYGVCFRRGYRRKRSFEGKVCEFCRMRGSWGVLIETDDRRLLIGSQNPDPLIAALRDAGVNTEPTPTCAE